MRSLPEIRVEKFSTITFSPQRLEMVRAVTASAPDCSAEATSMVARPTGPIGPLALPEAAMPATRDARLSLTSGSANGRRCFAAFRPRTPHSAHRLKRKCPNADEKTAPMASDTDSSALTRNAHLSDALVGRRC
jgi:hypothetical protein